MLQNGVLRYPAPLGYRLLPALRATSLGEGALAGTPPQPYRESKESFAFPAPTAAPGAKEKAPPVWRSLFALPQGSFRAGSANGTYASTCAALDAGIRIDDVFAVALRDRADGAFCRAGAASDAFIRNLICHGQIHLLIGMPLL